MAVALIGVIIMIMDPNIVKDGEKVNIIADLLTLGINLPWILYFLGSEYIKTRMDIEIIAFLGTAFMFFFSMIFSLAIEGTAFDASDDGIFGFFQPHNAYICFVWNAIFAGFFAFYGYNMALLYYPTVFVMNFLLVEPFISQIIGVSLGIDQWPGWMTFVGAAIVMLAINVMYQGEVRRNEDPDEIK